MLISFFEAIRKGRVPATLKEFLDLMHALDQKLVFADLDEFYYLSRLCLVKDERHFDKFDRAYEAYFEGIESIDDLFSKEIPEEWLRTEFIRQLSEEEKAQIEAMGGLDALMEAFRKRLEEQHKKHKGGNKMIGTGGTSPFGADGYNPEGFRIGQQQGRHGKAVKVWQRRAYRDLDGDVTIGIRNIKMALRRLRKFARLGAAEELDMDNTIHSTARNAGYLDLKMRPERHNSVKVLLFFDIGGSMDPHVKVCEELFSAARTEFKHMENFYFHNFLYESVWKDSLRRHQDAIHTWDIIHKYTPDYKVIFVGDASMAPYEITHPGGSVEHWNEEAGALWMQRITDHFDKVIWINPMPEHYWGMGGSMQMTQQLLEQRMFPMTVEGLEAGMRYLSK
jgi:uncharacterized protein with von Willebrand factor type A (vWA) domain